MIGCIDSIDLAKYIIHYYNKCNEDISNLKLQKILYYIQGYYLKKYNELAFESKIYSWPYGPVIKDVYYRYNMYGGRGIVINDELENIENRLPLQLNDIVKPILSNCKTQSAFDLVRKTHLEAPWKNTAQGNEIAINLISDYFSENNPLDIEF